MKRLDMFLFAIGVGLLLIAGLRFKGATRVDAFAEAERVVGWKPSSSAAAQPFAAQLVIYSDYACAVCGRLDSILREHPSLVSRFHLRRRHFPIIGGETSRRAALLAICEERTTGRTSVHEALSLASSRLSLVVDSITVDLQAVPVANVALAACTESTEARVQLEQDIAAANALGIVATPAIMLDSMLFRGLPENFVRRLQSINQ